MTGPCWSCDAPSSPAYRCARGHVWFACEDECGQKVEANGIVDWDDCHECQDIARDDEAEFRRVHNRDDFDHACDLARDGDA